jgi:hypothetical protein
MRRWIAVVVSFLLLCCPLSRAQTVQIDRARSGTTWKALKIGAGGFLTGIDIASDGTKVVRTDTYGAYYFNSATGLWQQIVTTNSMPAADTGVQLGGGVYEIAIAPSNTQRFYMVFNGYVYRTDNRGTSWVRTEFSRVTVDANDNYRGFGRKIAVDPANADVVYVGTPTNGLFVSLDAGVSWSRISAVGAGSPAGHIIAFDPSSSVSAGKTQGIYVSTYGIGVYHSTNGGTNWSLTTGTPTKHRHMICDQNGIVWMTDDFNGSFNYNRFSGDTWTQLRPDQGGGAQGQAVAVDPANASNIVFVNSSGQLNISTDGGAHWKFVATLNRLATDIPWLAWTNETFMSAGDIGFDPTVTNRLYFSEGIGVWYADISKVTGSSVTWTSLSASIEQLALNWIISPPGGSPILTAWDRPAWTVANPDVYPSTHGLSNVNEIVHGWSADWASVSPSTIVIIANSQGGRDTSGLSTDGGMTWHTFGNNSPVSSNGTVGGSIAASTSTNFVWVPTDNGSASNSPWYTKDGGASWHAVSISGIPSSGETGWSFAYYLDRQIVAADRVNVNTFYMYNYGPAAARSAAGVYKSTDGGATWSHVHTGSFPNSSFSAQMRSVPAKPGHLFFTSGIQSPPHPANQLFYRSVDGGATWNAVPNVKEVFSFGFGKAAPGQTYPAIFIYGWVNNALGIWRSDDNTLTWKQISDGFPLGSFAPVKVIEGDNNIYGTVYVGLSGNGWAYGKLNFLLKRDPCLRQG